MVWMTRLWPSLLGLARVVQPAHDPAVASGRVQEPTGAGNRQGRAGRPRIDRGLRDLIRRMSKENPLWGAPRIHGELLKLGFEIAESTVSKYMIRRRGRHRRAGGHSFATMRTPLLRSICAWFQP